MSFLTNFNIAFGTTPPPLRVYVAGPYNGPDVLSVLRNIRRGIELSSLLLQKGYAPFCPWLDFQFGLTSEIPLENYKQGSMAFLRVCDCVLLALGWESSPGALEEIKEAKRLNIPVFETCADLDDYREEVIRNRETDMCRKAEDTKENTKQNRPPTINPLDQPNIFLVRIKQDRSSPGEPTS